MEERRAFKKVRNWDVETHASLRARIVSCSAPFPSIPLSSSEIRAPRFPRGSLPKKEEGRKSGGEK